MDENVQFTDKCANVTDDKTRPGKDLAKDSKGDER